MTAYYASKNIKGNTSHARKEKAIDVFEGIINIHNNRQNALFNVAMNFRSVIASKVLSARTFKDAKRQARDTIFRRNGASIVADCFNNETVCMSLKERNLIMDSVFSIDTGKIYTPKRETFKKLDINCYFAKVPVGEGYLVCRRSTKQIMFEDGSHRFGWTRFVNSGNGKYFMRMLKKFNKSFDDKAVTVTTTVDKNGTTHLTTHHYGDFSIIEKKVA